MRTNVYESAVIINAALDDQQIESEISRIKEVITNNAGEIKLIENWGRKRLAYLVKKSKTGYYVIFRFSAPSNLIAKLDRFYTLNESIIRHLTIKLEKEAVEYLEKNQPVTTELVEQEVKEEVVPAESNDKAEEAEKSEGTV